MIADGLIVGGAVVTLTVLVQVGGIAYFAGVVKTSLNGFGRELEEHKELPVGRAHPKE